MSVSSPSLPSPEIVVDVRHVDDEALAHSLDIMILQDTEYFEACTDRWHRARGGGFVLGAISLLQVHRNHDDLHRQ
jgi:hypothetical protein